MLGYRRLAIGRGAPLIYSVLAWGRAAYLLGMQVLRPAALWALAVVCALMLGEGPALASRLAALRSRATKLIAAAAVSGLLHPWPSLALYSDELTLSFDTDYLGDAV